MRTRICAMLLLAVFFFLVPPTVSARQLSPFAIDSLVGKPAPDFTLPDQNGRTVTLSAFRGRPVLLNFWAPWAPNSRAEVMSLIQLRARADMKDLVILGITLDRKTQEAEAFLRETPVDYPILQDPGLIVSQQRYSVFMSPTTLLIDRNGIIRKLYFGQQEWGREKLIRELADFVR